MKRLFLTLLLLFGLGTVVSCAKHKDASQAQALSQSQDLSAPIPTKKLEDAKAIALSSKLECDKDCEAAVGFMVGTRKTEFGAEAYSCTAVLVGPDLLLTSSHCLPDDLRDKRSSCKGRMQFYFLGESDPISCANLLLDTGVSDLVPSLAPGLMPDLALIRLERASKNTPLAISHLGVEMNEKYSLIKTDALAQPNQYLARQSRKTCVSAQGSIFNPFHTEPLSSVLSLGDCEAQLGNSGAAIVANDNSLRASLNALATIDSSDQRLLNAFRSLMDLKDDSPLPSMLYATNLAALDLQTMSYNGRRPNQPPGNALKSLVKPSAKQEAEINLRTKTLLQTWISAQGAGIEWNAIETEKPSTFVRRFIPSPLCRNQNVLLQETSTPTPSVDVSAKLTSLYQARYEINLVDGKNEISLETWTNLAVCPLPQTTL